MGIYWEYIAQYAEDDSGKDLIITNNPIFMFNGRHKVIHNFENERVSK